MATIELTNIGPVEHVSIPVPEEGGLVVLRARNGKGKTRTLEAVESALTGKGSLEVRDRALNGKVEAFGITITVGRSTRRKGELEVESLDGKLSISELIDPGLKSPDAADNKRIKALCALAGAKADSTLFYSLCGSEDTFVKLVSASTLKADDLVSMAERVKRDLEAEARKLEDSAEKSEGVAVGLNQQSQGVDTTAECDSAILQDRFEEAVRRESKLKAMRQAFVDAVIASKNAADLLEDAEAEYTGLSVVQSLDIEAKKKIAMESAHSAAEEAKRVYDSAVAAVNQARTEYSHSIAQRKSAEQHESTIKQWKSQLESGLPEQISDEQLSIASSEVIDAKKAIEQGALARKAKESMAKGKSAMDDAKILRQRAARMRDAAKGTDDVLSGVVGKLGTSLRVEAGRLVLDTSRGATFYDDLSAGERSRIAIDIGIDAIGENGVLTLSQEIFEGLDPANRSMIADHAWDRGVVILTAEASDDETIVASSF